MRFIFLILKLNFDYVFMKKHLTLKNIVFLIVVIVIIIPQTREPLQILFHKGLSYIHQSSMIDESERVEVKHTNWKLTADDGSVLSFSDTKDKVVFINIWATWCPPCIAEMPSLQELYNDYKDKVTFVFLTSDGFDVVKKFKEKRNFDFVVHNSESIPEALFTKSIPRTFIINKKGEIVVDESGAVDWNSDTVRSQLNQLLSE